MKLIKKVAILSTIACTMLSVMHITPIHAASTMRIDIEASKTSELKAGDIIDVTINFSQDSQVVGGNIDFTYDDSMLEIVKQEGDVASPGSILPTGVLFESDASSDTVKVAFAGTKAFKKGGDFAAVKFKVKENVYGDATFNFTRLLAFADDMVDYNVTTNSPVTINIPNHLESISVSPKPVTLTKGATQQLSVTYLPTDTTDDKKVTWTSSDSTIASVDANGLVTAVKTGIATITASVGDKKDSSTITVVNPLTSISFDKTEYNVVKGQPLTLTPILNPSDADVSTLTWNSSNVDVATIDATGVVTAKKEGVTTITVSNGTIHATTVVNVKEIHIDSIEVTPTTAEVLKNKTVPLEANVTPNNTTDDATITWKSMDESIATVNEKGIVTGCKEGSVEIIAQAGNKTATSTITVKEIHIDRIDLNADKAEMLKGQTVEFVATLNPNDTTDDDKSITWTSSDNSIATVENGRVKGLKEGIVTISAKHGALEAKATVTIKEIHINEIELDKNEVSLLIGKTSKVNAILKPTNTTDDDKTIQWSSSNESIATVSEDGTITAQKEGNAIITAKHNNVTANVTVTVKEIHIDEVVLDTTSTKLKKGATIGLIATYNPSNTTDNASATWSSSDEKVASVDTNGKVTALKEGTASITVTIANKTATCEVTVYELHLSDDIVQLTKDLVTVKENEPYNLSELLNIPSDITDTYEVTYKIENEDIVLLENDTLLAKQDGNTKLRITITTDQDVVIKRTVNVTSVMEKQAVANSKDSILANTGSNHKFSTSNTTPMALIFSAIIVSGAIWLVLKKKKALMK